MNSEQNYHLIFIVDDKEYLCRTIPELRSLIESNTQYKSREIKFFHYNKYNKALSDIYKRKFNLII